MSIGPITAAPTRPLLPLEPIPPGRPPLGTAVSFAPYLAKPDAVVRSVPVRVTEGAGPARDDDASPGSVLFFSHWMTRLGLKKYSLETYRPIAQRVVGEYNRLGAGFQPSFVLDWGSYVNDNSTVAHLSLLKLNQSFRALAQRGMVDTSLEHLVRHEMAHAFLNTRWTPEVQREFETVFGPLREYDVTTWRIALSNLRRPGPDFVSAYAQTHPDEDFAETAALYVQLGGDPARIASYVLQRGGSEALRRKFNFVRRLSI